MRGFGHLPGDHFHNLRDRAQPPTICFGQPPHQGFDLLTDQTRHDPIQGTNRDCGGGPGRNAHGHPVCRSAGLIGVYTRVAPFTQLDFIRKAGQLRFFWGMSKQVLLFASVKTHHHRLP